MSGRVESVVISERERWSGPVIDLIYVFSTLLFFVSMLGYVAACDRLGRKADVDLTSKEQP
jgi:hypothetical protein